MLGRVVAGEDKLLGRMQEGLARDAADVQARAAEGGALLHEGDLEPKLRRAEGKPPGRILAYLLDGERPVTITARIRSSGGTATVDVQEVQISGVTIEGRMLDFLIHNYVVQAYPSAKVGEPFALGHRIERLDVQPSAVGVLIGR